MTQDTLFDDAFPAHKFSGATYEIQHDEKRLTGQLLRIFDLVKDGQWRTLDEISKHTQAPHASVSAQLRNLKKQSFGSHGLEKRSRGDRSNGLFEYRLIVNEVAG